MKKITLFLVGALFCTGFLFGVNEPVTLVHWDFHKWTGGGATGVPAGVTISTPLPGDYGLQAGTVFIGSENMFEDGEGGTVRNWGTPSAAGYVRTSLMVPGTFYRIKGLTSLGYRFIKIRAGFAADSSSRFYYLQLQYRLGSTGGWVSVGDPAFINVVNETAIPVRFDNVELPEAANNATSLEIRFLVTALDGAATTTQSRMDNVIITAQEILTSVANNNKNTIKIFHAENNLVISGAEGLSATVYTVTGSKVITVNSLTSNHKMEMMESGIYIVKIGMETYKFIKL